MYLVISYIVSFQLEEKPQENISSEKFCGIISIDEYLALEKNFQFYQNEQQYFCCLFLFNNLGNRTKRDFTQPVFVVFP